MVKTPEDFIRLSLKEPKFFINLKRKYDLLQTEIKDPRFLRISLERWNYSTKEVMKELLDFLGFPSENRPIFIPVKTSRNFEHNIPWEGV